jgi:hypothetical protein
VLYLSPNSFSTQSSSQSKLTIAGVLGMDLPGHMILQLFEQAPVIVLIIKKETRKKLEY